MPATGCPARSTTSPPRSTARPESTPTADRDARTGVLRTGTSGFAYAAWAPRFYPAGTRPTERLVRYAERLTACELNGTFYRRPTAAQLAAWRAATPDGFRFIVKAQRGAARRVFGDDPAATIAWLTDALPALGDRLGAVLLRVPDDLERDDRRLDALLMAWPAAIPLVVEFGHPSWLVDETFARLRAAGAVLCATETDAEPGPPTLRVTGSFLYLRLRAGDPRRHDLTAWAGRLTPFLVAGLDAYVFVRHDETGVAAEVATALVDAVTARVAAEREAP